MVDSLTKKFGHREVLHAVSLGLERGSVFGVIGPNGAGKTTVTRCLLDIIRRTAGTSTVLGGDPAARPVLRRRIGNLPGELFLEGRKTHGLAAGVGVLGYVFQRAQPGWGAGRLRPRRAARGAARPAARWSRAIRGSNRAVRGPPGAPRTHG